MTNISQYFIPKTAAHLEFRLKLAPSANIAKALGFPNRDKPLQLWVEHNWHKYVDEAPRTNQEILILSGKMNLDLYYILHNHFQGHSWQHVPEYPDL